MARDIGTTLFIQEVKIKPNGGKRLLPMLKDLNSLHESSIVIDVSFLASSTTYYVLINNHHESLVKLFLDTFIEHETLHMTLGGGITSNHRKTGVNVVVLVNRF